MPWAEKSNAKQHHGDLTADGVLHSGRRTAEVLLRHRRGRGSQGGGAASVGGAQQEPVHGGEEHSPEDGGEDRGGPEEVPAPAGGHSPARACFALGQS